MDKMIKISPYVYPGVLHSKNPVSGKDFKWNATITSILEVVSKITDIDMHILNSLTQKKEIVRARYITMYYAVMEYGVSLVDVARFFNGKGVLTGVNKKSHSTVNYAIKKVRELYDNTSITNDVFVLEGRRILKTLDSHFKNAS